MIDEQLAAVHRDAVLPDVYLRALHAVGGGHCGAHPDLFGTKAFTDTTHSDHHLMPPQEPRAFSSFDEAASRGADSRLYGGIHFSI